MAVVAIGFTSCGNKTQQGEAVDSVALIDSLSGAAAQEDIDIISKLLESADAAKLQEALANVKEKIATLIKENPEVAKEYVTKVQTFLKDNADKVKEVVGDNAAVSAAVSAVTDIEPESVVNGLLDKVSETASDAEEAVNEKVDEAKAAAEEKATEMKDAAKQKASDAVDNAAKDVKNKLGL